MKVQISPSRTELGRQYDTNDSGDIEHDEVLTAVSSYIYDEISEDQVAEVVALYGLSETFLTTPSLVELAMASSWYKNALDAADPQAFSPGPFRALEEIDRNNPEMAKFMTLWPWVFDADMLTNEREFVERIANLGLEAREFARQLVGLSWLADGFTEWEQAAIDKLLDISWNDIESAGLILRFPWVADGITYDEAWAIARIRILLNEDREFGRSVLGQWWVLDDMLRVERYALSSLVSLRRVNSNLAWQAIKEPFMKPPFRNRDQHALGVLVSLARVGPHSDERHTLLAQLSDQPWFRDGLDDLDAALLYAITNTWGEFRQNLIDSHYVASKTVTLPLSGEVDTVVVRSNPFPLNDHTFGALEDGLRNIEDFMEMPFPVNDVILIVTDPSFLKVRGQYRASIVGDSGVDSADMRALIFVNDTKSGPPKDTIYHELGHYYFLDGPSWLQEGTAHLLEDFTQERLGVESIEHRLSTYGTSLGHSSQEQLYDDVDTIHEVVYLSSRCDYRHLGERFLLEMYFILGPDALAAALGDLYSRSRRFIRLNEDAIFYSLLSHTTDENMEAFETTYRRYHGGPAVDFDPVDSPDWLPLVALYSSTNGEDWKVNENWSVIDAPLGARHGVSTGPEGGVHMLDLENNNLDGMIPPEFGNLSNLQSLLLAFNSLSGELPPELGNLSSLTSLDLRSNRLGGEIPPELGNLSNLESLSMWGNQLSGELPPELGSVSKLTWLDLDQNSLEGSIPPELSNLTSLEYLSLRRNRLSGRIPSELESLSNLHSLFLEGNRFNGCKPVGLREVSVNDLHKLDIPFCGGS